MISGTTRISLRLSRAANGAARDLKVWPTLVESVSSTCRAPWAGFLEMKRRRPVFTPVAVATIHELAREGNTAAEIAAVIGSTPASVRVKCCHLKIRLARGRPRSSQTASRQPHYQKLTLRIHPALYTALKHKSAEMQKSADELAGLLLKAIIISDLYQAVLDDGA